MEKIYKTSGVCSKSITFDVEDNKVKNISFAGGCSGNLKGIGLLCEGLSPKVVAEKLKGVTCGHKATSCPDQLAKALEEFISE